ncbi:uncharacterized protein LOC123880565 isoform X5 [Maniola jurtina]|uniref:uncharacterized protein LOC123880565 isoform X5 n=1 Tax=Maniola jurtina TaxID=191418 RepID=UPI001E68B754|nr:uncharacterized protein LOC123880565 isoform X5 [Maniola jurtina]
MYKAVQRLFIMYQVIQHTWTAAPSTRRRNLCSICKQKRHFSKAMLTTPALISLCKLFLLPPLPVLELCDLKMLDSSSSSSVMPNTTYSLSEMYEDALEVVAHDSDYMESIGMSEPVNCVFCGWAGSILLLDGHIRNDHACSIYKMDKSEWNITYTLKSLTECDAWLHRVIEYDDTLYLISVKYERPACFMATISLLSLDLLMPKEKNASMTLFNKSTGEPFSWTGHVPNFPPGSPSDDGANGLKLQLDLLDNTTVSQDIDVTVFVSIYNK